MLIPCLLSTVSPAAETPCALDEHLAEVALGQKEALSRLYLSTGTRSTALPFPC